MLFMTALNNAFAASCHHCLRQANTKRQSHLTKLWKAKWYGALELKEKKAEQSTLILLRNWSWEPAFGLIEGFHMVEIGEAFQHGLCTPRKNLLRRTF